MLTTTLTRDHRACDAHYAEAEEAAQQGDWNAARRHFQAFCDRTERHFQTEESQLFPHIEALPPVAVMRSEHRYLRECFARMASALQAEDLDAYLGEAETQMILLQQHNMKEEQILYPMAEQFLGNDLGNVTHAVQACLA